MSDVRQDSSNRAPAPFVWLALWVSVFLEFGCFSLIPIAAVHRPSRYSSASALPPDWKTPLLLVALFASMLTWQAWYEQKNGTRRRKPSPLVDETARRKQGRLIGLILAVPLLLLECLWVFAMPGTRVNWPLLAALNAGCVVGIFCFLWGNRRLNAMKASADLAPPASPVVNAAGVGNPVPAWYSGSQSAPSETTVSFLTFLCCFAIIALAFLPGFLDLGTWPRVWPLAAFFGSMTAFIAFAATMSSKKSRRADQTRYALTHDETLLQKTPKEATSAIGFVAIGLMFFVIGKHYSDWPRFLLCCAGQFGAYLLLRWTLSRPPSAVQVAAPPQVNWLPKRGVVRATPTEIVLAMPWQARAFIGGFGLIMAGMTVMCLLLAFAPGLFDPPARQPHGIYRMPMPLILFVAMVFFTTLVIGGAGPRDLRLELDSRRYAQVSWKPWPGSSSKDGFFVPFCVVRTSGTMDADMTGVCVREYTYKGSTSYILQIVWRDKAKPAAVFNRFSTPEEAQIALAQAADALQLPPLDTCP